MNDYGFSMQRPPHTRGGRTRIERFRRMMDDRGSQYAEDFFTYTAKFGAIAAGASAVIPINIEKHSAFEALQLTGGASTSAGGAVTPASVVDITLVDSATSRSLMNARVPMINLLGSGQEPFILPIPRRFMAQTQLTVVLHNYSAGTALNNAWVSFHGRKIFQATLEAEARAASSGILPSNVADRLPRFHVWQDPESGKWYCEDFYIYDTTLAALADATTTAVQTIIEGDSDFEWIETTFSCVDANPTLKGPTDINVLVSVQDGGTQRNLQGVFPATSTAVIPAQQMAGIGRLPFILRQPRIFLAKTPVNVLFTNSSGGAITDLHLSMLGRKIFELD